MIDLKRIEKEIPLLVEYYPVLDSTSLYLKRCIAAGDRRGRLVIAGEQTNGQGRVGKSFYSPANTGLYFTITLTEKESAIGDLTPRVALGCKGAVDALTGKESRIKWVNDVYLFGGKVAGILCQRVDGVDLVGIGVNLASPGSLPEELRGRFSSLYSTLPPKSHTRLLLLLYHHVKACFSLPREELLAQYRSACFHIGAPVSITYNGEEKYGVCVGIGDDFSLLVQRESQIQAFSSGVLTLKE